MWSILPCCLPYGKAGGLQILCCQGIKVTDYDFTLDALALKPSDFCNVRVSYDKEHMAFSVFSEWGAQASKAVPAIIDILKTSNDPSALGGALFTLKMIGTQEALQGHKQFKSRLDNMTPGKKYLH
jgi:hypothetical protein